MKRHPKPLWDRQGRLIFRTESDYRKASPLKNGLPERSTFHSRKVVKYGSMSKKI